MSCPGLSLRYGHMLQFDQHNGLTLLPLPMETSRVRILPRSATASLNVVAANHKLRRGKKFKKDKEYPWPDKFPTDGSGPHVFTYVNRFKPLEKPPKRVLLPFEKPLAEVQRKINEVKKMQKETGLQFERYINILEIQYNEIMQEIYSSLTPFQRLSVARHPNRPTCLEHVSNISDKWLELHGDRAGYDDPAIVTGIGSMDGMSFMFIGHQKGRNTKENIHRNFGMPTPHGYRKALRIMLEANQFGLPIITFVDTPGAYADIESERKGQGEAIAQNLRSSFGLRVPFISVVIGEGGSGGALAIGTANRMLMLENSVYFVASPEAAAAILYKSAKAAPKAAVRLKITAEELREFGIADEVIPEPLGGAHADPKETSKRIKHAILRHLRELKSMSPEKLKEDRKAKFIGIGHCEDIELDAASTRNMKADAASISESTNNADPSQLKPEPSDNGAIDSSNVEEIESQRQQYIKVLNANKPKGFLQKLIKQIIKK
ncbi:uncharacterized protein LOC131036172 isoform X1 [Cryptomeria japonica]|uniref:uncharacterized protein LOC131036172 isoform X1 n=1 Tax=Cryptomeria japonica TaxID=3369 RepID=UPI0025AD4848|nr:uncharacterized protein LOC131036172 isoform X1 [Cryptomeria japonica]